MTDDVFELRAEALAEELGIGRHPPYCIDSVEEATPIILAALREAREEGARECLERMGRAFPARHDPPEGEKPGGAAVHSNGEG
jgi:hypothetical protein